MKNNNLANFLPKTSVNLVLKMTIFQKFILIIIFFAIGMVGFYLFRQEQIKKDELSLKGNQQKVSECKYLLANKDFILKKETEDRDIGLKLILTRRNSKEETKRWDNFYEKAEDALAKAKEEYEKSSVKCRDLLRQLGN